MTPTLSYLSPFCMMRRFLAMALSLAGLAAIHSAVADAANVERQFIWDQANAAMARAVEPSDFSRAAEIYGELLQRGAGNGHVYYNLGTALLQAGQYDEARKALERAERYQGHNPDILRNLTLASAHGQPELPPLPWYRVPLFWHYGLSYRLRMSVFASAFAVACMGVLFGRLGWARLSRPCWILGTAFSIIFASSIAATLYEEYRADTLPASIIPADPPNNPAAGNRGTTP